MMAASHQPAKLASYSLQILENPNIGARVAQFEREDLLESLAAVVAALEEEEEEEEKEEHKAVRRAPAQVMKGRDVGWGWDLSGWVLAEGFSADHASLSHGLAKRSPVQIPFPVIRTTTFSLLPWKILNTEALKRLLIFIKEIVVKFSWRAFILLYLVRRVQTQNLTPYHLASVRSK